MNWSVWMAWAMQRQGRILFLFFILVGASHIVFAPAAAYRLWRLSRGMHYKVLRYTALAMLSLGIQGACDMIAAIDAPQKIIYSTWYVMWFWGGRTVTWACLAFLSWYILWPWSAEK